jgi:hypothetical protein
MLNLPGTKKYNPVQVWISKRLGGGSMACKFVCFMDSQSTTRQGQEKVIVAGHTISWIENYLGVQDALKKLRLAGGTCLPSTWAGAPLF